MYIFIVNPIAGNGRSKKIYERLTQTDTFKRISSDVYFTKYKGHARKIVSEISEMDQSPRAIIVIGGDGTMNDIANGMEHFDIPIGFIPGGSGNDFARGDRKSTRLNSSHVATSYAVFCLTNTSTPKCP